MKFKTILSLSAAFCMLLSHDAVQHTPTEIHYTPPKPSIVRAPDLKFHTDTICYSGDTTTQYIAGRFFASQNKIIIYHFIPQDSTPSLKNWCDTQLRGQRFVIRHEVEHARKAHIIHNQEHLPPYQRGQLAIMNEMMAAGGEIIEAMTYRMETNQRTPTDREFLFRADSLIMSKTLKLSAIDFHRSEIADIILKSAADKFVRVYRGNTYHKRVHNELQAPPPPKYTPHKYCDSSFLVRFDPQNNDWGALWTYNITPFAPNGDLTGTGYIAFRNHLSAYRVDIWNTATESARQYVLEKVDSCIHTELEPGQILQKSFFTKTH